MNASRRILLLAGAAFGFSLITAAGCHRSVAAGDIKGAVPLPRRFRSYALRSNPRRTRSLSAAGSNRSAGAIAGKGASVLRFLRRS